MCSSRIMGIEPKMTNLTWIKLSLRISFIVSVLLLRTIIIAGEDVDSSGFEESAFTKSSSRDLFPTKEHFYRTPPLEESVSKTETNLPYSTKYQKSNASPLIEQLAKAIQNDEESDIALIHLIQLIINDNIETIQRHSKSEMSGGDILNSLRIQFKNQDEDGSFKKNVLRVKKDVGEKEIYSAGLNKSPEPAKESERGSFPDHIKRFPADNPEEADKNSPSIDEIISGIVQLLGGNVQVSKPPSGFRLRPSAGFGRRPSSKRVNDRGPARFPSASITLNQTVDIALLKPSSVLLTELIASPTFNSIREPVETTATLSTNILASSSEFSIIASVQPSPGLPTFSLDPSETSVSSKPLSSHVTVDETPMADDMRETSKVQYDLNEQTDDSNQVVSTSETIRDTTIFTKLYTSQIDVSSIVQSSTILPTASSSIESSWDNTFNSNTPVKNPIQTNVPYRSTTPYRDRISPTSTKELPPAETMEIVYGKPSEIVNAPTVEAYKPTNSSGGHLSKPQIKNDLTVTGTGSFTRRHNTTNPPSNSATGRPYIVPVEIEEVRPFVGAFPGRPGMPPINVGGIEPGKRPHPPFKNATFPSRPDLNGYKRPGYPQPERHPPDGLATPNRKPPSHTRPHSRPRPHPPLVRIDTCIVGDDSTCDVQLNERCVTELGISSCHCRPGFARTFPRGPCIPVVAVSLSMKIDRFADRPLKFNKNFLDSSSDEYRLLEQEATQAMNSLFGYTSFSRTFMGATVDKFYPGNNGMIVNTTIQLEENESNKHPVLQRLIQQEVLNAITSRNLNIGDSSLYVDSPPRPGPIVQDLNECELVSANDCSTNGICQNTFGAYRCVCKPGYMDKFPSEEWKSGRTCSVCSPTFCSSHGECVINDGQRECNCKGNYIGTRCEIDGEVLGVALGASLAALVIIILTLVCLCIWNRRWKHDQQKAGVVQNHAYTMANKNGPCPSGTHFRISMDDRMRRVNPHSYLFHQHQSRDGHLGVNSPPALPPPPPPLNTCSSSKHIYATPSRMLLQKVCDEERNSIYGHVRPKSRSSHLAIGPPNPSGYYDLNDYPTRDNHYGSPYGNPNSSKSTYY